MKNFTQINHSFLQTHWIKNKWINAYYFKKHYPVVSFLNTVWCMQKPYLLTQWLCTAKKKDQALFQNAYIKFYVLHINSTSSSNITTSTSVFSRQTRNKNGRVYCRFLHYWTHELLLSVFKDFQYCSTFLLGIFYSSRNFLLDL